MKIEPMTIEKIKELYLKTTPEKVGHYEWHSLIRTWAEAEARARKLGKLTSLPPGHLGSCGPEMGCDDLCSEWFYASTKDYLAEVLREIGFKENQSE